MRNEHEAFAAVQRAEVRCTEPELSCLLGELPQYGATPESEKLFQQNLNLLEMQKKVASSVTPEAVDGCRSASVTEHSDRIVDAYQAYAKTPVVAPFVHLQKAFIALHTAELGCLSRLPKQKRDRT